MSVFIFHTDTLNKYSWQEVRDGYKILRRYDLSLEDIKKMKWTIPYPPDESMAGMKMYRARRALDAGMDAVELHGANKYLIHQFCSPAANLRTDDWGGTHYEIGRASCRERV